MHILIIGILGVEFTFREPDQLVTQIVNPRVVFRPFYGVLTTVVVGVNCKFFRLEGSDFVIVNRYPDVFSGDALREDDFDQVVYGATRIENVVDQQDLVAGAKVLGAISPPVDHHPIMLVYVGVGPGHDRGVENGPSVAPNDFEILAQHIAQIRPSPQTHVYHVGNETFLVNAMCELDRVVAYLSVREKLFVDIHRCLGALGRPVRWDLALDSHVQLDAVPEIVEVERFFVKIVQSAVEIGDILDRRFVDAGYDISDPKSGYGGG